MIDIQKINLPEIELEDVKAELAITKAQSQVLNALNVLDYLRRSLLGVIYQRYLKRYPLVRAFVLWTWKIILPATTKLLSFFLYEKLKNKSRPLIKMFEYSVSRQLIYPSQSVVVALPQVFSNKKGVKLDVQAMYEFPEIYIATIQDCILTGASNFLNVKEGVICHDLFECTHDYTSEELHCRFVINSRKSVVRYLYDVTPQVAIKKAVVFTDAVSRNYAHFLTEVLPRVFVFSRANPNADVAFIIDSDLHANLTQALNVVVDRSVDWIELSVGQPLLVRSLQVVSTCGYVPFERRPKSKGLTGHSHGVFSPRVLIDMRDFIKNKIFHANVAVGPNKIYIKRNSSYRNLHNAEEVESALVAKGFVVIEPEKLSFIEQVILFSNADVLVGATGAAFANLIFCKPETKIIILISDYKNMIYGYWRNMASAVGNNVTYVIGECTDASSQLHSNFQINISDISEAISD